MKKITLLATAAALLASSYTYAAPVTLESTWGFGSRRDHLELLRFTFDDATPDSDATSNTGVYLGAISAVRFEYYGEVWSFDPASTNNVMKLRTDNSITMNTFALAVGVINTQGQRSNLAFAVEASPYFKKDTLASLPEDLHGNYGQIYLYSGKPNEWDLLGDLRGNAEFREVSSVPLPGALTYFISSAAALALLRRGKSKKH